ncbi:hypothetical protein HanIR_Chr17g0882951 [Helianthus annuus]|nr:hypothetical protein HanIR_Chr17g0882951 [Helianthus annuus]
MNKGLRERNLIGMGECKGGLYRMGTMEEDRRAMTVVTSSKWNKRLGHPSHDRLSRIHFLKVHDYKTPYEVIFGKEPSYEHMRVFGCLAYFWNTETKGDKFAPKGKPGI